MAFAPGVLTFMIVGKNDHPMYEVDLTGPKEVSNVSMLFEVTRALIQEA